MSKTTKIIWGVVVVVIIMVVITSSKKSGDQIVKIGVIAPLSGPFASAGEEIRKGINSIGTSTKYTFIFEDEKCDPKDALSAFRKLNTVDKVNLIIGPGCGSPQESLAPILSSSDSIALVPSAASKELFITSGGKLFNMQYSLEKESEYLAKILNEKYKRVAVIHYQNAFSETHWTTFFKNFGGEIIDIEIVNPNDTLSSVVTKIKNAKPDAIYSPDLSFFLAQGLQKLKNQNVDVPIYGTYVVELPFVRPLVDGVYYSYPDDLKGDNGAIYELSRQAGLAYIEAINKCDTDTDCIRKYFFDNKYFDDNGISNRNIVIKKINGNDVEVVK